MTASYQGSEDLHLRSDTQITDRRWHYYSDESSTRDSWLTLGGLGVRPMWLPAIQRALAGLNDVEARKRGHPVGEVKWEKAGSFGGRIQEAYIRYLFELVRVGQVHFHIFFAPMDEYDHSTSGDRRRLDTISRQYYQFLLHRALQFYGGRWDVHVFPDRGECSDLLPEHAQHLRSRERSTFNRANPRLVEIKQLDSAQEPLLQLLDVTLGALASHRNDKHRDLDGDSNKRRLSDLALQLTGWTSLEGSTSLYPQKLNRWTSEATMSRSEAVAKRRAAKGKR